MGSAMLKVHTDLCSRAALHILVLGSLLLTMCFNGREMNSRVITEVLFSSRTWNCVLVPGAASNLWWLSLWSPGPQGLPPSPGHQAWEKKSLGNQGGTAKAKLPGGWKGANGNGRVDKQKNPFLVQRHLRQNHGLVALLQDQN